MEQHFENKEMGRIGLNDWQTIQSRKEIQNIRRMVRAEKVANWSIVIEIAFLVIGFCLDCIFGSEDAPNYVWVIISICAVVVPLLLLGMSTFFQKRKKDANKQIRDIHEIITMFDDELCYYVMTACSFLEYRKNDAPGKAREAQTQNREQHRFYLIEASYYLNKSVNILSLMRNNLLQLVDKPPTGGVYSGGKISYFRFENVILLMSSLYKTINDGLGEKVAVQDILQHNERYIKRLNDVIRESNRSLGGSLEIVEIKSKN